VLNSKPDRRWWTLLGLLVLVAHASLFGVGPVGEDFPILVETSRAVHPDLGGIPGSALETCFELSGTSGRPLAALSLVTSSWFWSSDGIWTHVALGFLRLENLLLLTLSAFVLCRFLRRLVAPWVGSEGAQAAGQAALLMLMVHPLSVTAVATPAARGDLLGAAFGICAAAAFLRGRQERSYWLVASAAPLVLLSTLASELGYLLPLCLGFVEYFSSRRYRPQQVRLRTGITTVLVFGAFASLDVLLRLGLEVNPWPQDLEASIQALSSLSGVWYALLSGLTKIGVLILPVNGANAGGMGFVVATLLLVAVLQPALHAGLSAPRFWLTVLCCWLTAIVIAGLARAGVQVGPGNLSSAATLLPAVIVMVIVFALASTSVSGSRRQVLPIVVACLLCTLARSNARGWREAAKDAEQLATQMAPILTQQGPQQQFLVVDAPGMVDLYAACPDDLGWMFDRAVRGMEFAVDPLPAEQLQIQGLSRESLLMLTRLKDFDQRRAAGLVIVFHMRHVQPSAKPRWVAERISENGPHPEVHSWLNAQSEAAAPGSSSRGGHWVGTQQEAPFFADPATLECLTIREEGSAPVEAEGEPAEAAKPELEEPEIYWRARGAVVRGGVLRGVWLQDGEGRTAVFDPGSDLDWLLGQRVDSLLLMGELAEMHGAEVWAAPPAIPNLIEPAVDGDDWSLGSPKPLIYLDTSLVESWHLTLLDLDSLKSLTLDCELDSRGMLVAQDAEELSQGLRNQPGSLAWGLERRVGDLVLQRVGGRF
jgi:hypothetical protein